MSSHGITRRDLLRAAAAAPLVAAHGLAFNNAPAGPVAIARCRSYDAGLTQAMSGMFDQLGGLGGLVKNKTVTIKLNLTGSPSYRFQGKQLGLTHYTHPNMAAAVAHLMESAGARRVRFVESAWASSGPLEEYMLDSGWNVRKLFAGLKTVEFENTNALGKSKSYVRFPVPGGGAIYPAYMLNHAYHDTDVFVSMAKLKNHATCGVTLAMKNCFGITPASIYGDDAGKDEPNEKPASGRVSCCHEGKREPSKCAPQEINPSSSRDPGHRMPRIVADLAAARPIHLSIIDGIASVSGGEGPWIRGLRLVEPGVIIAGLNPVNTDAVATAVMGYDPRAPHGTAPFTMCDNTLLLAEVAGVGSADLKRIDVRGAAIKDVVYPYGRA